MEGWNGINESVSQEKRNPKRGLLWLDLRLKLMLIVAPQNHNKGHGLWEVTVTIIRKKLNLSNLIGCCGFDFHKKFL